ncbi:MAG: hypothetical protein VW268_09670 [Rhodospirillaceae bacterium]
MTEVHLLSRIESLGEDARILLPRVRMRAGWERGETPNRFRAKSALYDLLQAAAQTVKGAPDDTVLRHLKNAADAVDRIDWQALPRGAQDLARRCGDLARDVLTARIEKAA